MKTILLSFVLLFSFACKEVVKGQLDVRGTIALDGRNETQLIPPGKYKGTIEVRSNRRFDIELDSIDDKFRFKLARGVSLPFNGGEIDIDATQNSQGLDIFGRVELSRSLSETYSNFEGCTYRIYQTICRPNQNGGQTCTQRPVDVRGTRYVQYHIETLNREFEINLLQNGAHLADFDGDHLSKRKIYTYAGQCR